MIRILSFAAAAFALVACASTPAGPPYTAAASASSAGYSETQIESNRYFVTYRAPSGAEAARLEDYALLRAAELTLQNGREWFWVDRRSLDQQSAARSTGPSLGVGIGGGSYGRSSGASVGVGFNIPLGNQPQAPRARGATYEIRFGEGPKPDDANAYDARSTSQAIRARISTIG
ncbi:CC0125/CC1285 family lipoprotein [Candidatus Viadribacter manganicus]|uniref:DUF4136 domain-containing protein n=1 Tax=Candidatus Viadribacter manganicus TaxID=1759059 RepID=A0A1B1AMP2_9PROT|nr:hypothetical protein [Candidatus Viadribacter manganicus]ANP47839.1 hypothetical protein ATE48_19020 [Candidatus Viadribacter manganicus]